MSSNVETNEDNESDDDIVIDYESVSQRGCKRSSEVMSSSQERGNILKKIKELNPSLKTRNCNLQIVTNSSKVNPARMKILSYQKPSILRNLKPRNDNLGLGMINNNSQDDERDVDLQDKENQAPVNDGKIVGGEETSSSSSSSIGIMSVSSSSVSQETSSQSAGVTAPPQDNCSVKPQPSKEIVGGTPSPGISSSVQEATSPSTSANATAPIPLESSCFDNILNVSSIEDNTEDAVNNNGDGLDQEEFFSVAMIQAKMQSMEKPLSTVEIFDYMRELPMKNFRMDETWTIKEISTSAIRKIFGEDFLHHLLLEDEHQDSSQDEEAKDISPSTSPSRVVVTSSSMPELVPQKQINVHEEIQEVEELCPRPQGSQGPFGSSLYDLNPLDFNIVDKDTVLQEVEDQDSDKDDVSVNDNVYGEDRLPVIDEEPEEAVLQGNHQEETSDQGNYQVIQGMGACGIDCSFVNYPHFNAKEKFYESLGLVTKERNQALRYVSISQQLFSQP